MPHNDSNHFIPVSEIAVADPDLRSAVASATLTGYNKRLAALFAEGQDHGENLRQAAAVAKRRALHDLPALLEQAEANMQANGMHVLWARDSDEANRLVLDIARRHDVKRVAKGKSMVSEEIDFNHVMEAAGLEVVETDLGEFIIQLNEEIPSHIVLPIIHKTKAQIREILQRELDMPYTDDAAAMTAYVRHYMREKFLSADMGISGGNFILAETGTLCLVCNEGNGRLCTTLPRVHVALVGIEKVVATLEDYALLTQILPRSATGQNLTVYTNLIHGPRRSPDEIGPEEVYVILVDNGRSDIYASAYAEVLTCIRCGACQNACPVYRSTGGQAYGWVYGGPIGAVLTPLLTGLENAKPLPHASSLCGACKQVCPVDIDLPRMLLDLRHDLVQAGLSGPQWSVGIKGWEIANSAPRLFELSGGVVRWASQALLGDHLPPPLSGWTRHRDFPPFAPKPFRQLWRERQAQNGDSAHG
jgi:L-lactate dehydrogenase complex protein LldF